MGFIYIFRTPAEAAAVLQWSLKAFASQPLTKVPDSLLTKKAQVENASASLEFLYSFSVTHAYFISAGRVPKGC